MLKALSTIIILFMLCGSLSAMEREQFEDSLENFTVEKLSENRDELYSLFPTFGASAIVPNFQEITKANDYSVNAYIVDQIAGAIELYQLKQIETDLNRKIMIEERYGTKKVQTYKYQRDYQVVTKSDKQVALERERSEKLAPIKGLVVRFPMLINVTRNNRVATTKLFNKIIDRLSDSGMSLSFLYKTKSEKPYELSKFLFLLLDENKKLKRALNDVIGAEIVESIETINESIEEIRENGAKLLIHNNMLLSAFWNYSSATFDDEITPFNDIVSSLREEFPKQDNNITRLLLGTGLMVTGAVTSFTGVSLGAIATGAVILAGSSLAVLDGIETHKLYEINQINNGLFLSRMISKEDHLENKKLLLENLIFTGIDIVAAPMDALALIRLGKGRLAKEVVTKMLGPNKSAIPFLEAKGIDFEPMIDAYGDQLIRGFEILPSDATPLNKYIKKAMAMNPDIKFVYVPGYLGDFTMGSYNDGFKTIQIGHKSLKNAHLPTYLDSTIPHELMHSLFYKNFRNDNYDYAIKFFSKDGGIDVPGYTNYMSIQESRTFTKTTKNELKILTKNFNSGDDIEALAKPLYGTSRHGKKVSNYSRDAINGIIKRIDAGDSSLSFAVDKVSDAGAVITANIKGKKARATITFNSKIDSADALKTLKGRNKVVKELRNHLRSQKKMIIQDYHYQAKLNALGLALLNNRNELDPEFIYKAFLNGLAPNTTRFSGKLPPALLSRGTNPNSFKEVSRASQDFMAAIVLGKRSEKVVDGKKVIEFVTNMKAENRKITVVLDEAGNFINFK